ncbi:uncharacterized protein LOC103706787 isoform X1 [Phoenix dactylifera]|uniref:Uncharacterized protein LOC103706787 isoform X1 n=1 Tax=Phoenix dactylifera TaxID=42345 RepID=A0A8B8J4H3_PHODC|nr:uncharacterized protein LOC103706787 isoform X1 [Phoenix dactylifera]
MVGIVARFQGYMTRPQPSLLDKKEGQVAEEAGTNEIDVHGDAGREEDDVVVEIYAEFKPVDHPLEPPDEDPPAKWPMPDSSLLNVGGILKQPSAESLWKKTESLAANEEGTAEQSPAETDRKRHHSIARDPALPSSFRSPHSNIFQVFQQCKEFQA